LQVERGDIASQSSLRAATRNLITLKADG
jgi:hypothetical protein